jgi:RNase E specificity factor CsrD
LEPAGSKQLDVEVIKLHPGLSRNIEKRTKISCWCKAWWKPVKVCIRKFSPRAFVPWRMAGAVECGVSGGQGDFFAASQPLDTNVKKYSQRYSV